MREVKLLTIKDTVDEFMAYTEKAQPVTEIPSTKEYDVNIVCEIDNLGTYKVTHVSGKPQNVVNYVCALTKVSKQKLCNVYWLDNFKEFTGYDIIAYQDVKLALKDKVPAQNLNDVMKIVTDKRVEDLYNYTFPDDEDEDKCEE